MATWHPPPLGAAKPSAPNPGAPNRSYQSKQEHLPPKMAIEIVDFPILNMVIFHSYVSPTPTSSPLLLAPLAARLDRGRQRIRAISRAPDVVEHTLTRTHARKKYQNSLDAKLECQIECQNICQIEYQKACQIECKIKCKMECQNICQIECWIVPERMPDIMSEYLSERMSVGWDHSKKVIFWNIACYDYLRFCVHTCSVASLIPLFPLQAGVIVVVCSSLVIASCNMFQGVDHWK